MGLIRLGSEFWADWVAWIKRGRWRLWFGDTSGSLVNLVEIFDRQTGNLKHAIVHYADASKLGLVQAKFAIPTRIVDEFVAASQLGYPVIRRLVSQAEQGLAGEIDEALEAKLPSAFVGEYCVSSLRHRVLESIEDIYMRMTIRIARNSTQPVVQLCHAIELDLNDLHESINSLRVSMGSNRPAPVCGVVRSLTMLIALLVTHEETITGDAEKIMHIATSSTRRDLRLFADPDSDVPNEWFIRYGVLQFRHHVLSQVEKCILLQVA